MTLFATLKIYNKSRKPCLKPYGATPFTYQIDGLSPFMRSSLTFEMPELFLQGTTNNDRLKFSVGDTTPGFPIGIEQDN